MTDPFQQILLMEREGNFNRVISIFVENYDELALVRPELFRRIAHLLDSFRPLISPRAIDALYSLPPSHLQCFGFPDNLKEQPDSRPEAALGRITFPVMTTAGLVREIHVTREAPLTLSPRKLQVLDRAGSAVFKVLRARLGRHCLWGPGRFSFSVLDPYGKDDPAVTGDSMSLPLALALYSCVVDIPLPPDLSATGSLGRDGSIGPVAFFREKMEALRSERFFIERVLVSDRQEGLEDISGIRTIRVSSLDHAVSIAFNDFPFAARFSGNLDLDAEIRALNNQYDGYLIDTCIENADELIRYLQSKTLQLPVDRTVPALFTCYWKKGCCHCHKGDVKNTASCLKKALELYRRYPGVIRADDYFDSRISYAVLLKDIFRYKEAEAIHLGLIHEMQKSRSLDHVKGKNLSTLSQLYLAMGRFSEAEQYQRQAMQLINRDEVCRNYGYLAQVHTRTGAFQKAAAALSRYRRLLDIAETGARAAHTPFYHWIRAEYLYRRACAVERGRRALSREVQEIAGKYPAPVWWVPALVHKFSGLACLKAKEEEKGLHQLERVIHYFSTRFEPVLRVLGASVRVERAMYFLSTDRHDRAVADIRGIMEDLSLQKDTRRFFKGDLLKLSRFLKSKGSQRAGIKSMLSVLDRIRMKIPY